MRGAQTIEQSAGPALHWRSRLKLDDADLAILSTHRLHRKVNRGYEKVVAVSGNPPRAVTLARLIMNAPDGREVDHINGDPFDNRRTNLRICSASQNRMNQPAKGGSSAFKGVYREGQAWLAAIKIEGRRKRIGRFTSELAAATAYDVAARELHGEFATLNFPEAHERSGRAAVSRGSGNHSSPLACHTIPAGSEPGKTGGVGFAARAFTPPFIADDAAFFDPEQRTASHRNEGFGFNSPVSVSGPFHEQTSSAGEQR